MYEWEVQDVTPPDTELLSVVHLGPTDLIEPDSLRFELRGSDNATAWFELEFECQLDNGPWEGCDTPFHYLPLEELPGGQHVMRIRAMDDFENVDPTPVEHHFTTEAGPETTILSGPAPETGDTTVTFTFAADPALDATFECSLDLAPFTAVLEPVHDDRAVRRARARGPREGPDGRRRPRPRPCRSWASGDVTPPVVTIHSGPAPATTSTDATFNFTVDDPEAALQCSLDGGPLTFCESPLTYDAADLALATGHLSGAAHALDVTATKQHLLVEAAGGRVDVEGRRPHARPRRRSTPARRPRSASDLPVAVHLLQQRARRRRSSARSTRSAPPQYSSCASPPENSADFSGLEPGEHRLLVRAVDPSLNADATPAEFTWTVVGPALTTITADVPAAPATTTATSATFSWTRRTRPASRFTCSFDGAEFAAVHVAGDGARRGGRRPHVRGAVDEPVRAASRSRPRSTSGRSRCRRTSVLPETTISSGPPLVSNSSDAPRSGSPPT